MRLKITTPKRSFDFTARHGSTVIVVGTRPLDDICIDDDPKISGPHVRLEGSADDWSFTDQFSDAGTIHNGVKTYNGDLKVGDVLQVGDTEIRVLELEGSVPAPAPAFEPKFDTAMSSAMPANEAADPLSAAFAQDFRSKFDRDPPPETREKIEMMVGKLRGSMSDDAIREKVLPVILRAAESKASAPADAPVFVRRIIQRLVSQFQVDTGIDISSDIVAMQRVGEAAEKAVHELEAAKSAEVNLPFLAADASGPKHLVAHLARKHLHETGQPVAQTQESEPPAPPATPKPNNKPGVAIAVAIILFVGTSMVIFWALEESAGVEQDVKQILDEAQAKQETQDQRQEEELALQRAVVALMEDKETPPQELMDSLDRLEGAAKAHGMSTGWDFERARTYLESRVYSDVSNRSNVVSGQVYDMQEQRQFRQCEALVRELDTYLKASPHNQRAITVLELDESVKRWSMQNHGGTEKLLAIQVPAMAEAQSRDDFAAAAKALEPVVAGALLDAVELRALDAELKTLQSKAAQQESGELPPGRRPFDKRKDKLPESPDNKLLKAGDYTARTGLSSIRYNIIESVQAGEWDGRKINVWGLGAEVEGDSTTVYVPLVFTWTVGEQSLTFIAREQLSNYPPAVQLALFEQVEAPELEDLMAMLIFAFDNGLMDDAGRIALKVRQAAPDKLAELDAILAAKWRVAVPEGGFPERDGKIVAK
jgi:hypothetical protein